MSRRLDSVYTRDASPGPHYDASLGLHYEEKLHATLTNVWRNKLLVIATITAALTIGIALALMMPKTYTAEAYIREGFATFATDAKDSLLRQSQIKSGPEASGGGAIPVDASELVETRSRLLQSRQLARGVVERLGLERIRPVVAIGPFASWLWSTFYGDAARVPGYEGDMAAERLLRGLSVKTEPRVYGIVVRYSAGDPELAALITNAFVVEFREAIRRQILSQERDSAERALSEALATFGEKHPKVMEAKARLEHADALLREQSEKKTTEETHHAAEDGNVSLAQAVTVPSSPNPLVCIGVALLVGVVGGILMAAFQPLPIGRSSSNRRQFNGARQQLNVARQQRWEPGVRQKALDLWRFGLSAGQIAEKLGVTRNAVTGIVHRAKANRWRAV